MIQISLVFLIISGFFVVQTKKTIRTILYLGIFSLISSVCFLFFAAPDVAMAEATVSAFSTILFIVAFEKHADIAGIAELPSLAQENVSIKKYLLPLAFVIFLLILFIYFIPSDQPNEYLKEQYISGFSLDVGGENAVTAIYLGYRMYDTLFEALMLLISIVAVVHMSQYKDVVHSNVKHSGINKSDIAFFTIRLICPLLVLTGVYLIMNGHISPGGGFQGGVLISSFFIGRYMIHHILDIKINRVIALEKLIYVGIILLASYFILLGAHSFLPIPKSVYLIMMNFLIGMKVACGFFVIFYRFIAIERS